MTQPEQTRVHPTAIITEGAELGTGVEIGPYAIIGPRCQIGDRCKIDSHAVISGHTKIGADNRIWSFASIGTEPQDLKYKGEDSELIIGERNLIREYVNLSIGTEPGGGVTTIGSDNLFMVNAHVAHDCIVGDGTILANGVSLGGHVRVGDRAVLGGHSALHQFTTIGSLAMIAGGAIVVQDVPPYCMVHGNHAKPSGLNSLGLKRAGFSRAAITEVKTMYRLLYQSTLTCDDARDAIQSELAPSEHKATFLTFLESSNRGVCR